jgi:hypothetical protein
MTNGNMPWYDGIRHTGELAVQEMYVGAAHFRVQRAEHRGAGLERRPRQLAELDRRIRRRNHRGANGFGHGVLSLKTTSFDVAPPPVAIAIICSPVRVRYVIGFAYACWPRSYSHTAAPVFASIA